MQAGDAAGFFAAIRARAESQQRLRRGADFAHDAAGGGRPGEQWGYATCPADEQDTSVVTVTGMLFA